MGARLVREEIGNDAAPGELGNQVRAIADEADRRSFALAHGIFQNAQSFIQIVYHHIAVARFDAALDSFRINVDAEECGAIQRGGERLRTAHSAHSSADD